MKQSSIQGYGVFAECDIKSGEIIEECYAIMMDVDEIIPLDYSFYFDEFSVIPTGYGILYNHADNPNATYFLDKENQLLVYKAIHKIRAGDEILVSYGNKWFKTRDLPIKKISRIQKIKSFLRIPLRAAIVIGVIYGLFQLLQHI